MNGEEMVGSPVWVEVYNECWRVWKVGLDRLRKAENGVEAGKAKQQMEDVEEIARLPLRYMGKNKDAADRYRRKMAGDYEKAMKGEFEGRTRDGFEKKIKNSEGG